MYLQHSEVVVNSDEQPHWTQILSLPEEAEFPFSWISQSSPPLSLPPPPYCSHSILQL